MDSAGFAMHTRDRWNIDLGRSYVAVREGPVWSRIGANASKLSNPTLGRAGNASTSTLLQAGASLSSRTSTSSSRIRPCRDSGANDASLLSPGVSMQLRGMGFNSVQIVDAMSHLPVGAESSVEELLQVLTGTHLEQRQLQQVPRNLKPLQTRRLENELNDMGFPHPLIQGALERTGPNANLDDVVELLCNLQSEQSAGHEGSANELVIAPWECSICFSDYEDAGWQCSNQHRFCVCCMQQHVNVATFPRCPDVGCSYVLKDSDLRQLNVPVERLQAFQDGQLQNAISSLATNSSAIPNMDGEEVLMRCRREGCANAVLMILNSSPSRFECPCGAASFCTHCLQAPYHFHGRCEEVQALRERWLSWLSIGRQRCLDREHNNVAYREQVKAVRDGIQRHQELKDDEKWKAAFCRCCPGCLRPVQKIDGCDSMVCGQDCHGGNEQQGCGLHFDWRSAKPYRSLAESRPLPKVTLKCVEVRGKGAFHPFVHCDLCSEPGDGLKGIRFRCIHCPSFNVCSKCEPKIGSAHDTSHVFEIMYETDFDWSAVELPEGTRVRIVRCGTTLPPKLLGKSLEGKVGSIRSILAPATGFKEHKRRYRVQLAKDTSTIVPVTHVEPLVSSQSDMKKLIGDI